MTHVEVARDLFNGKVTPRWVRERARRLGRGVRVGRRVLLWEADVEALKSDDPARKKRPPAVPASPSAEAHYRRALKLLADIGEAHKRKRLEKRAAYERERREERARARAARKSGEKPAGS